MNLQHALPGEKKQHERAKLTIGQVARRSGINAKAIRYYESTGLLPPAQRSENGYRHYTQADINRLLLLRRLRLLGVSLDQLAPLLRDTPTSQCLEVQQEVLGLINDRLEAIDQEMMELHLLRVQVEHYHQQLLACHPGSQETFQDCHDLSCLAFPVETPKEEFHDVPSCVR